MSVNLDFTFDTSGFDRAALLDSAAQKLDEVYSTHLGDGQTVTKTDEGNMMRALINDRATLPAYPDVYRITDNDFLAKGLKAPVKFLQLAEKYKYYWIHFPIGLHPELDWAFNRIELKMEFNKDTEPHLRPKAYQIMPDKKFQTLFKTNATVEFSLNGNIEFEAKTGKQQVGNEKMGAKASVDVGSVAKLGAGAVLGPFEYHVKKAKIEHSATGLEWIFWRLDGNEFFQENTPELVTILQVPNEVEEVTIDARLDASRYFSLASARWQNIIKQLPTIVKSYFQQGLPSVDIKPWNITPSL